MTHPVTRQLHAMHDAVNNNDLTALQTLYCEDAFLVDKPRVSSRSDLQRALSAFKQRYMPEHIVSQGDEVVIEAGDTALVISKLYLNATGAVDCNVKRAIYVFRKNAEGEWQCAIDNFFGVDLIDYV